MTPTLEEATLDQIFAELKTRFPCGLVMLGLRPAEGSPAEAALYEDRPTIYWCGSYAAIGLMAVATKRVKAVIAGALADARRAEDDDEDDEEE